MADLLAVLIQVGWATWLPTLISEQDSLVGAEKSPPRCPLIFPHSSNSPYTMARGLPTDFTC
ncbi:MAG: hypothetical protein KAI83_03285 [Thiomargarita sp.]|nr:hypothetical protein [Thiomargarita sp.]